MRGGKLWLGIGGAVGVVSGTTSTTTPTPTPTPTTTTAPVVTATPTPTPTPTTVTASGAVAIPAGYTVRLARDFGVMCDGITDDTAALQNALNGLRSFEALQLPSGTCRTSNQLLLSGKTNVVVSGAGKDSTIIQAQDPLHSAFIVYQGNGVAVQNFQVYSPNSTVRLSDANSRGFYITNSTKVTLQQIKARRTSSGVAFWNVTDSSILNSEALDTWSDSFHITGNTQRILVQYNVARGAGDDSFSSIGYLNDGTLSNIQFLDNASYDGWWGSGVSFEGTLNGVALRNKVYRSGAACMRVASNSGYKTVRNDNITMSDNYLEGCVTRPELIDAHGAIMIYSDYQYEHGLVFERNTIKDSNGHMGFRFYGLDSVNDVAGSASNNIFLNTIGKLTTPFSVGSYGSATRTGNMLNGVTIF